MPVTLIEKVKNKEGTREARVFKNNLKLQTTSPTTISETEATLQGIISDFFPPAFFDDSVDIFFAFNEADGLDNNDTKFVGSFSGKQSQEVVTADIDGLTRNEKYEFFMFAEIDNVRISSEKRTFRTGAFNIETDEVKNVSENEATFVGKLAQFQGLVFENTGPFDIISEQDSGAVTFENRQESESPLFILDNLTNSNVRTGINMKDKLLNVDVAADTSIAVSVDTDLDFNKDEEFIEFSNEQFDLETPVSREITAGFEFRKKKNNKLNDIIAVNPPEVSGDLFEATASLDPNSDYEFRAFGTIGSFERERGDFIEFSTLEKEIIDLKTIDPISVDITEAEVKGEVTNIEPQGRQIEVAIQYGKSNVDDNVSPKVNFSGTADYTSILTALDAGSTYDYRAYAVGNEGTYVGPTKTFETDAIRLETVEQPTAQEEPSKQPTEGTAYLFGEVTDLNPDASGADVEFEFGTEEPLTQTVDAGSQPVGEFDLNVTGLEEGEEYKYRLVGTDPQTGKTEVGNIETFSTISLETKTLDAESVGRTEATLNGAITTLNSSGTQDVYFEYREKGNTTFQQTSPTEVSGAVAFDETITGLTEATVFEYRAVVEKNSAVVKGSLKEFQTDAVDVAVLGSENIKTGSATVNGEITFISSEVSSVDSAIEFKAQDENLYTRVSGPSGLSSPQAFSVDLTGLEAGQTYEYRVVAIPDSAREQVSDNVNTFTTTDLQVTTENRPQSRTTESLTVGGELTTYGGTFLTTENTEGMVMGHQSIGDLQTEGDSVEVGHEYVALGGGGIKNAGKKVKSGTLNEIDSFNTKISGLQKDRTYLVRSYAKVNGAIVFGSLQGMSTSLNG